MFDVICRSFDRSNKEQCTLLAVVCWSIWNRHSKWIWEKINMSVFGIKSAALNLLAEWKMAHAQQILSSTSTSAPMAIRKWEKPQHPWVKVNIDALHYLRTLTALDWVTLFEERMDSFLWS